MKLESKNKAPKFSVKDYKGNSIRIENYKESKVLLTFFRGASCSFSNLRIKKLIQIHKRLEDEGLKIIVFFASNVSDIEQYISKHNAKFPIVYDPDLEIYNQYGIESSKMGRFITMLNPLKNLRAMFSGFFNIKAMFEKPLIPADFLINEDGWIEKAHYGSSFGDHLELKEIINWSKNKL